MPGQISLTREQYVESIRALMAAAEALATKYDMRQLTWQPLAGEGWSMLECLDHLTVSTGLTLDAIESAAGDARAGAGEFRSGGAPSEWFLKRLEPPPSKKVPAPASFRPRPTLNPEGVLPQFQQAMERTLALVRNSAGKDLNGVRYRNPVLPLIRFTAASGLLIIAAHGRRHLWQAEQVAKDADFPAA